MPYQTLDELSLILNRALVFLECDGPQSKLDGLLESHSIGYQPNSFIQRCRERLLHMALTSSSIPFPLLLGGFNMHEGAPIVGSGGSSDVFCYTRAGKAAVAVKKFLDSKSHSRTTFIREVIFISSLRHQNIIAFLGAIDNATGFAIVTPYLRNGDLPTFLRQNPSADRLKMAQGIACGLGYLRFCGVIHSDIKGLNILVNDDHVPVISDFGLAVYEGDEIDFDGCKELPVWCGTLRYMAPERLSPDAGNSTRPTFSSDIFSFGMVLYEIYTERFPYWKLNNFQAVILIMRGIHPAWDARIPDHIWSLASACWNYEPSDRPPIDEVVNYLSDLMQRKM